MPLLVPSNFPRARKGIDRMVFSVKPRNAGMRLDQYLQARFKGYSRNFFQRLIRRGDVRVDDAPGKASQRVAVNQTVTVMLPEGPGRKQEEMDLEVLYEDAHYIAVNKPPGVIIHPARGHMSGTLLNALFHRYRERLADDPHAHIGTMHRLDKDTTGVVIFGLNPETHAPLQQQFEHRQVDKRYLMVVHGEFPAGETTVDAPLGVDPSDRHRVIVDGRNARRAVTRFTRLAVAQPHQMEPFSLVAAKLITGRSHQIRAHCTHIGFPIVGDTLYGGRTEAPVGLAPLVPRPPGADPSTPPYDPRPRMPLMDRQALHAAMLRFVHPADDRTVELNAPLPDDMRALCERIGLPIESAPVVRSG